MGRVKEQLIDEIDAHEESENIRKEGVEKDDQYEEMDADEKKEWTRKQRLQEMEEDRKYGQESNRPSSDSWRQKG